MAKNCAHESEDSSVPAFSEAHYKPYVTIIRSQIIKEECGILWLGRTAVLQAISVLYFLSEPCRRRGAAKSHALEC